MIAEECVGETLYYRLVVCEMHHATTEYKAVIQKFVEVKIYR